MPKGAIILKGKQTIIIMLLKNETQQWNVTTLAKATSTTYVHVHNFLAECIAMGLATSEKHGRIKLVKLTERGMQLANMVASIYEIIEPKPEQKKSVPPQT